MKKFVFIFFVIVLANFTVEKVHAAPRITATLDKDTIAVDEEGMIVVTVSGVQNYQQPIPPRVAGLTIVGVSDISSYQSVNGQVSFSHEVRYSVIADDEGDYKIPSFGVFVQGVEYKTQPLTLHVVKKTYTSPPQQVPGNLPQQFQTSPNVNAVQGSGNFRFKLVSFVDNADPFVGQQILYHFKVYTRESISQSGAPGLPDFNDFIVEKISEGRRGTEVVDGQECATWEMVYALMPLKAGTITLNEASLGIVYQEVDRSSRQWDPFNNNIFSFNVGSAFAKQKQTTLKAPPIELHVKALPEPIPTDFTGLVGDFGVQTSLSANEVSVGESVTYEVQFSGQGNVKNANLPQLNFDGFKVYYDKPQVEMVPSSNIVSGRKSFKIALVPERAGDLKIPAFTFSYFDPHKQIYNTLTVEEKTIHVLPAATETTNAVIVGQDRQNTGAQGAAGLHPLISDAADVFAPDGFVLPELVTTAIIWGCPFVFVIVVLSRVIRFDGPANQKKRRVRKTANKLNHLLKTHRSKENEVLDALKEYMSALFTVGAAALTAHEIRDVCQEHGVKTETAESLGRLVEQLEATQYGFGEKIDLEAVKKELKEKIQDLS